jgi:V/A-type H+-transporting ATPase subunit E
MPIENILRKIEEEASAAAARIVEAAKEEGLRLGEEYSARASKLAEQFEKRGARKAAEEKHRILVSEQLELRKAVLKRKREILGELYSETKRKIEEISGEEYLDLLESMIVEGATSGSEEIVPASGQKRLFTKRFIEKLNKSFASGASFSVAGEEGDFTWGVVLREGRRMIDLSLETVFGRVIEELEPEVSGILFPGDRREK